MFCRMSAASKNEFFLQFTEKNNTPRFFISLTRTAGKLG